jgi:hypothetical protein
MLYRFGCENTVSRNRTAFQIPEFVEQISKNIRR